MADGFGLREKLDARIAAARRSLLWPALIRAILPALVWFTVFAVFWLSGLYSAMPLEAQATTGVIFWVGFITTALIGWKVWKAPTDDEARDLIDSAIEGRPLSTWTDRPAKPDTTGWTLWQEHRDRMAARQGLQRLDAHMPAREGAAPVEILLRVHDDAEQRPLQRRDVAFDQRRHRGGRDGFRS